ncbi:MAG: helix-turn-helix domain-containing protein, partial [Actinobacteria bacterium]|nr:helix-turn-helix domain-containing protein [Actinomycetota bacterium]
MRALAVPDGVPQPFHVLGPPDLGGALAARMCAAPLTAPRAAGSGPGGDGSWASRGHEGTRMPTSATGLDPAGVATRDELSEALTALREQAGLTVRDVARRTGIPVATVGGWFSGQHVPPVAATAQVRALLAACGVPDDATQPWLAAIARARRKPGRRPVSAAVPFRGLAAFQAEDAPWFFGREELTARLVARVREPRDVPIVVVGPSGVGKSSLLRAGLIPALADGGAPVPPVTLLTPGAHPQAALDAAGEARAVVVDQAEEVFTAGADAEERHAFLSRLAGLAGTGTPVVLGLRADF